MVWDLRGALLKKAEIESARLDDFEFRLRGRTFRLLATSLGVEPEGLVRRIAIEPDAAILAHLAETANLIPEDLRELYGRCRSEARARLIGEIGDPTPYKLA